MEGMVPPRRKNLSFAGVNEKRGLDNGKQPEIRVTDPTPFNSIPSTPALESDKRLELAPVSSPALGEPKVGGCDERMKPLTPGNLLLLQQEAERSQPSSSSSRRSKQSPPRLLNLLPPSSATLTPSPGFSNGRRNMFFIQSPDCGEEGSSFGSAVIGSEGSQKFSKQDFAVGQHGGGASFETQLEDEGDSEDGGLMLSIGGKKRTKKALAEEVKEKEKEAIRKETHAPVSSSPLKNTSLPPAAEGRGEHPQARTAQPPPTQPQALSPTPSTFTNLKRNPSINSATSKRRFPASGAKPKLRRQPSAAAPSNKPTSSTSAVAADPPPPPPPVVLPKTKKQGPMAPPPVPPPNTRVAGGAFPMAGKFGQEKARVTRILNGKPTPEPVVLKKNSSVSVAKSVRNPSLCLSFFSFCFHC